MLDYGEIADRLTSSVQGQEASFAISIDGRWGQDLLGKADVCRVTKAYMTLREISDDHPDSPFV